jgi:hypothetical protein
MAARHQLPGMRWFLWMRIASLRIGILTGLYASCIFIAWLLVANRIAALVPYAETRNLVAAVALVTMLAIPALRFRRQPGKLFIAGLTACAVLTLTYIAAELHFTLLESRMGAFHVFMMGAVSYGFLAVLDWVFLMCAWVRHEHVVQSRQAAASAGRHRSH